MKIVILNENINPVDARQEEVVRMINEHLKKQGYDTTTINTAESKIADCTGCFGCWVKTPGECSIQDDQTRFLKEYINSDLCILISPVRKGFVSQELKKSIDRIIPIATPFFKIKNGKMTHYARYTKEPDLAILLDYETLLDKQNEKIIHDWITYCFNDNFDTNNLYIADIKNTKSINEFLGKIGIKNKHSICN